MREKGGYLDITDRQILKEASQNGHYQVRVINIKEMLEAMSKTEPEKYREFHKEMERQAGIPLTFDKLMQFAQAAGDRMEEFTQLTKSMTLGQAAQVRIFRVDHHMTWRAVARACWLEGWPNVSGWIPSSNQLMGIALCERAALLFKENYREPPWN